MVVAEQQLGALERWVGGFQGNRRVGQQLALEAYQHREDGELVELVSVRVEPARQAVRRDLAAMFRTEAR